MESLGQYLLRERRMREIGLEEITACTRIRKVHLQALEGDKHDGLPARPFVLGFLRAYAQYVGLDGEDLVTRYLFQLQNDPQSASQTASQQAPLQRRGWRTSLRRWLHSASRSFR